MARKRYWMCVYTGRIYDLQIGKDISKKDWLSVWEKIQFGYGRLDYFGVMIDILILHALCLQMCKRDRMNKRKNDALNNVAQDAK